MAVFLWALGLPLLLQGCWCSVGQTDGGCMTWTTQGNNVCCDACHPGHRLVTECGPRPKDLCTRCEPGTFTENPKSFRCTRCKQCVGAQICVKECTATANTQCGCKEGLTCGGLHCNFCVKKCDKGQEPGEKRSCRTCPHGTFNDQSHQMCKPWSTKCPNPDQRIVASGDAFTDIKCANISLAKVGIPKQSDPTEQALILPVVISVVMALGIIIIIIIIITVITAKKFYQKRQEEEKKPIPTELIIRTPTDDPRTLIAVECSFHEAQQEQGSSSESLDSKDSSEQLIA